ncbi:MAG: hypothetical protein WCP28_14345 [Actinomycetes bacterium]
MRALTVAAVPVQLELSEPNTPIPTQRWWDLPEASRASAVALLARLITRSVLIDAEDPALGACDD